MSGQSIPGIDTSSKAVQKALKRELHAHRGERVVGREEALGSCVYPPRVVSIIEGSSYNSHHAHVGLHRHIRASNAVNDFFNTQDFAGKRIVEFGPGHYSFAMIARHLGAEVVCVERHEEHARLGRELGFRVIERDFADVTPEGLGAPFDGLWMKGAFNACRMGGRDEIDALVDVMTGMLAPGGWGCCVTVNMLSKDDVEDDPRVADAVEAQRRAFDEAGWDVTPIREEDRKRYAMSYKGSRYYFTRGLDISAAAGNDPL